VPKREEQRPARDISAGTFIGVPARDLSVDAAAFSAAAIEKAR
jgi:hypothetical protein